MSALDDTIPRLDISSLSWFLYFTFFLSFFLFPVFQFLFLHSFISPFLLFFLSFFLSQFIVRRFNYNFGVIAQEYDTEGAPSDAERHWFYCEKLEVTAFAK
jgi:hypothetical protein